MTGGPLAPGLVGRTIGNYTVVRLLGRGGMGEVYEARHVHIGHGVAIKVLLPSVSRDQEVVQRFFNEARASTMIKHPGVVQISDVGWTPTGEAYIVMELLAGESLRDRLRRTGRMKPEDAVSVAMQVASAVGAAHALGIVHRDLKPENLFLVPEAGGERVKVLDFGIAKLSAGTGGAMSGLTQTGAVMGTPAYMAPEQWKDAGRVDLRADVYSLGCILFELLVGGPPFPQQSFGELVAAHLGMPPPDPSRMAPVAPALAAVVLRLLAKEPGDRPATMSALGEALEQALRAGGPAEMAFAATALPMASPMVALTPEPHGPTTTLGRSAGAIAVEARAGASPPRRRGLAFLAAAAVIVAAGAGGAWVLAGGGASSNATKEPASGHPVAHTPPLDAATATTATTGSASAARATGEWARLAPAVWILGVAGDEPSEVPGFRPARQVVTPSVPFEIQRTEVTWAQLDPYLDASPGARSRLAPLGWAMSPELPATGIPWELARDYCRSLGGSLPSEAQWERAARGAQRAPHPWGDTAIDPLGVVAFAAMPAQAGTSEQDATPEGIHDLAGNAQEWTADLWREDLPGLDETWVTEGDMTFRAVRGLPMGVAAPARWPRVSGTFRQPLCATGPCPTATAKVLRHVGFRCVRAVTPPP